MKRSVERCSRTELCAVLLALWGAASSASVAQPLVQSDFNNGAEGWTAVTFSNLCTTLTSAGAPLAVTWTSTGGATGGHLRTPDGVADTFWRAPASYRGNMSSAFGGSIRFEYRLGTTDADVLYSPDDIYIQSASLTLIADAPNPSRDAWGQSLIPLRPGYWRIGSCTGPFATESQIRTALSNISELYIRGEHVVGGENNDIDSVAIDATPVNDIDRARWEERDTVGPSGRWRHAIAVDSDRNVLVLFGGDTGENDTWEYDLSSGIWTRTQPPVSPPRSGGHAMAYDKSRGRIVMTGGGYLVARADVWEYDVQTNVWTQTTSLPQARSGHAMAYDTQRQTMVLYGGLASGAAGATDVLERSGGSLAWVARPAIDNPGAQIGYAMAYDAARQRATLVGGGTTSLTIWEWNGLTGLWAVRTTPGASPSTRNNPAVAYDDSRQRLVVAGGEGDATAWEYDGTTWLQRANIVGGGRDEHAMAYDPLNERVVLSGGILGSAAAQRDMLSFNGASNQWLTLWSRSACSARDGFSMIYDEGGQQPVIFGGGLLTRPGVTRQFGGGVFTFANDVWAAQTPSGSPGNRWAMPAAYDPNRRVMMVFGGLTASGTGSATARLWELNLATMAWSDRGNQAPGPRYEHSVAFDRARNQLVVFGGRDDLGNRLGDTWILDLATNQWTTLPPAALSPGLRNVAGMSFDESRGVVVLFGGLSSTASTSIYENSTWEWNGTSWRNVTPISGNPPARFWPRVVYDPSRKRVVMFAGVTNFNTSSNPSFAAQPFRDIWEWDGAAWSRIWLESSPSPAAIVYGNAVYDRLRDRIVHFGGSSVTNATYLNSQTFELVLPTRRCNPADIAYDTGEPLPPIGPGGPALVNNGATEADYNLFFATFFDAGPACDIADDTGQALPPFGGGGIPPFVNNGVTEGDYNLFFAIFFDGCAF
jgi:hypothetical protein